MQRSEVLEQISTYCRASGLAESTFGRRAVNDGKLVARIRDGGRITARTLDRIQRFIDDNPAADVSENSLIANGAGRRRTFGDMRTDVASPIPAATAPSPQTDDSNFRFFDNRQKYLLFVNTCGEKEVIAERVTLELGNIHPSPPAVRLFDAGMGDGSVLSRVMRAMHQRFPTMPFYVVGKEISLEDIRLSLDKMPDRFHEHPATVLIVTNLYYSEAPWLRTNSAAAASRFVWEEVALTGNTSHEFEQQIRDLGPFLSENWQAKIGKSGNPIYDRPVVMAIYREDHKFLLDQVIPRRGAVEADFDLVMASQPYRARTSADFKAEKVIAPLARALRPGGRLIGIHSCGGDPGMEIIENVWPGEQPFGTDRHDILKAVKKTLGKDARHFNFNAYADNRSIFKYDMHTLPNEVDSSIGTSTLLAAWNAAIYVAQIEDQRVEEAMEGSRYLDATRQVVQDRGGLWFYDESYAISRKRD